MKHIVMIIIAMGVACGYAQNRRFQNPWYQVEYSEALESPVIITYQVECTTTTVSRKGMDFKRVDSIHTSNKEDYKHNVWDKGHMAPAAAFACDAEALRSTFLYVNCALQHQALNRGAWRELEAWERRQAQVGLGLKGSGSGWSQPRVISSSMSSNPAWSPRTPVSSTAMVTPVPS
jgi:DNA/RNA endonuclease G (NUC1)